MEFFAFELCFEDEDRLSRPLLCSPESFEDSSLPLEQGTLTLKSSSVALQSAIVNYAQSDTCAASKTKNKRSCDVGTLGADIIDQTGTGGLFNDLI